MKKRILILFTLLGAAISSVQSVHAATITVTNLNDSGPGSLRQALADANSGDEINFSVTGTITLTSGELAVSEKYVTISGPGANLLAVSRPNTAPCFPIFRLTRGNCLGGPQSFVIKGLTIRNGCGGGGIFFQGCNTSLTVENCTLSDNFGTLDGGAIHNLSTLIVNDSTFSNNFAGLNGGGISNRSFGELIVDNCTFSNNRAGLNSGGAIFNKRKTTINNSTFSGNESGVYGTGAAVYSEGVSLIVNNSTISGNVVAARQHGAIAIGNDVRISRVSEIKNSTISGAGGCIYSEATLKIGGTILETTDLYATISGSHEKITSLGYNLSDDNGNGFLTGPGDLTNTEPLLGPLQNNGGPTFTHALLPGSPAIDTGNPSFTPPPNNDQRDCPFFRVYNGRIDIGSFEVQPPPLPCMTPRPRPTPTPRP